MPGMPTYSISKIAAEVLVKYQSRRLGVPAVIARLSVPYGDTFGWLLFHLMMLEQAMAIPVHVDAPTSYAPIHADDIAASIPYLLSYAASPARIVNWGGDEVTSVEEWCTYLGELSGFTPTFESTTATIPAIIPDLTLLHEVGFRSSVGWRDGFRRMVETSRPDLVGVSTTGPGGGEHDRTCCSESLVKLGLTIFATDQTIDPVELAREAEARGYSSLWLPEHTHIPVSRRTPVPTGEAELPAEYLRAMDPVTTLAACASVTTDLVLGSGISLVAQHDPIAYAKSWATLDHLSGGRAAFGIGFHWNLEEMEDHGVDPSTRREQAREHVFAMQALWRDDGASFDGEFVSFPPTWSWPKPIQRPRIDTFIGGGSGPKLFAHLAEYADGWLPIGGGGIRDALPRLHRAWAEAGRDGEPRVVPFGTLPTEQKLDYYRSLGCSEVVLRVPAAQRDEVLAVLDDFDAFL